MTTRRQIITGLGATAAWPLAAWAQQATEPVVGFLSPRSADADAFILGGLREGLRGQGYTEGRNLAIEYRFGDGRVDRLPALATDLVRRNVSVIVAVGTGQAAQAAHAASPTMPVVFVVGVDPVKTGLVGNLNHPGGAMTGVSAFLSELGQKRLGLVQALLPGARTIAVLANATIEGSVSEAADVQQAGATLGKQIIVLRAATERELNAALAGLPQSPPDALLVTSTPFFFTNADRIIAAAAHLRLPVLYARREYVSAGGLMSYGSSSDENIRVAGDYAGRILKGEKPGDLPVQQSAKIEFVINLKTAKTLGLAIPPNLLALADEVIE